MTPIAPARGLDQRHQALELANEIRYHRAAFKRALRRSGHRHAALSAGVILHAPPHWAQTMKVRNLLVALPGIRDAKADRLLIQLGISPRKTIAGMSPRQRLELTNWLVRRAAE